MILLIVNGSPRNKKSNSKILIESFLKGFTSVLKEDIPIHYLASRKRKEEGIKLFQEAEIVIIILPLYTDAMPGIVKEFLENIYLLDHSIPKKLGFIIQSGFPEAIHSYHLERYFEKFTKRINYDYLGSIIKGGVEGIQMMPPSMTKKLYQRFENLGKYFAQHQAFDQEIKKELAKPFRMSVSRRLFFRLMELVGLTRFFWNKQLKQNNAYKKRFDQPYVNYQ